ncbi:tetratricopeptide repeat protein [Pseudomonas borbori]
MSFRFALLACLLLAPGASVLSADQQCESATSCNQAGTAAYKAGRYPQAIELFERQLRRADGAGLELALNNLILANLKAGDSGMARAWLSLALSEYMNGAATRHHLAKVAEAVDYQALGGSLEGRYLRYGGQAVWSMLEIRKAADGGLQAQFSPLRAGAQIETYGPAAIGELEGRLQGQGAHRVLQDAGLAPHCAVELLHEGLDISVLEVIEAECQEYGGAGISVAGRYYKVSTSVEP